MKTGKKNLHRFVLTIFCLFLFSYSKFSYALLEDYLVLQVNGNYAIEIDKKSIKSHPEIIQEIVAALASKKSRHIDELKITGFEDCHALLQPIFDILQVNTTLVSLIIDGINIETYHNDIDTYEIDNVCCKILWSLLKRNKLIAQLENLKIQIEEKIKSSNNNPVVNSIFSNVFLTESAQIIQRVELNRRITELNIMIVRLIVNSPVRENTTNDDTDNIPLRPTGSEGGLRSNNHSSTSSSSTNTATILQNPLILPPHQTAQPQ